MGAAADFDNEGFTNLYVTGFAANTLLPHNGYGTFTDFTAKAGVAASGWSTSACFFDFDTTAALTSSSPAISVGPSPITPV